MMLSVRRDTLESLSSLGEDWSRRGSAHSNPVLVLPHRFGQRNSDAGTTTVLSPPPPPRSPKLQSKKLHQRLRSDSGLALHTNPTALRQYTDYNPDGSMRLGTKTARPLSYDAASNIEALSICNRQSVEFKEALWHSKPLPDFFDPEVVRMAFSHPTTSRRLCNFAQSRHCGAEMEFLLKVDEYSQAFGHMTSLIGQISTTFTGVTATSPLSLPADLSTSLRNSTKHFAKSVLPPLETIYRDAKTSVQQQLSGTLYPDYVKFQLTQCMRSSMSVSRSLTGAFRSAYPGLGDAFCLTDPFRPDNPIIYASDGLLRLTGYRRHHIMHKNCRIFQGITTDSEATRRIRDALALGREITELVVNHHRDGTPFWNLLFICPLFENGSVRYHLGAQINVSESMGTGHKDILRILNFGPPGEQFPPATVLSTQERPVWRTPALDKLERIPPEKVPSAEGAKSRLNRHKFFRRFSRKSRAARRPQSPRPTTPAVPHPTADDLPSAKRRAYTTRNPQLELRPDEHSTPYSRFFVVRYKPTSGQGGHASNDKRGGSGAVHMPVAFCSSFALELIGLRGNDSNVILGHDIFAVLAEYIHSPGLNRGLRSTVMERMTAGEPVSMDLMANADPLPARHHHTIKHSRNGSVIKGGGGGGGGILSPGTETDGRPRLSETIDRGAEILSSVFFGGGKTRKLVSHWVPLKDANGSVGWVVLILTPANPTS